MTSVVSAKIHYSADYIKHLFLPYSSWTCSLAQKTHFHFDVILIFILACFQMMKPIVCNFGEELQFDQFFIICLVAQQWTVQGVPLHFTHRQLG